MAQSSDHLTFMLQECFLWVCEPPVVVESCNLFALLWVELTLQAGRL